MKIIKLAILSIMICSCSQNMKESSELAGNDKLETIDITNPKEADDISDIVDRIKDVSVTQLETKSGAEIMYIGKMFVSKGRVVIFDQFNMRHQIKVFDKGGRWMGSSTQGRGPGEIVKAYSVCYDYTNNRIAVSQHDKITEFNDDMKLIKEEKCDFYFMHFLEHKGEFVMKVANTQHQTAVDAKDKRIIIADTAFQIKNGYTPIVKNYQVGNYEDMASTASGVIISEYLCDTLFLYSDGKLVPRYVLNYEQKLKVPESYSDSERRNYEEKNDGFYYSGTYLQAGKIQFFRLDNSQRKGEIYVCRNAETRENIQILSRRQGDRSLFEIPYAVDGDKFVAVLEYEDVEKNMETLRKVLTTDDIQKVEAMTEESNPMLVFYRIDI